MYPGFSEKNRYGSKPQLNAGVGSWGGGPNSYSYPPNWTLSPALLTTDPITPS